VDSGQMLTRRFPNAWSLQSQITEKLTEYKQLSLTKIISDAEGIDHMFCDPGDREREAMEYMDRRAIGLELTREWDVLSSVDLDAKAGAI
jgi:hypothetical protein